MGNKIDTNIIVDGQLAVATAPQTGTIIESGGEIDATALVQTENGPQLAVKTVSVSGGGGGGGITVDDAMSDTSTNPVQNKVITAALGDKQDTLVSGTNIKTVNSNSLLGSGNIDIDALPDQTGQSGKFLTTDGTSASWGGVPTPAGVYTQENLVGGTNISIDDDVDKDTYLLLHLDNNLDDSGAYAPTRNSVTATMEATGGKFDGYLDRNSSDIIYTSDSFKSIMSKHALTVEFWRKKTIHSSETPNASIIEFRNASNTTLLQVSSQLGPINTFALNDYVWNAQNNIIDISSIAEDSWFHVAVVYDGTNVKWYINGVEKATRAAYSSEWTDCTKIYLRNCKYMDEVRVSSIARWTADFTPPSAPYTVLTGKKAINGQVPDNVLQNNVASTAISSGNNGLGIFTQATKTNSIIIGNSITVTDSSSTGTQRAIAIGESSKISKYMGICIGCGSECSGQGAVAIGAYSKATGETSIAIGGNYSGGTPNVARGQHSIAIGTYDTYAFGQFCVAIGYQAKAGDNDYSNPSNAIALGPYAKAIKQYAIQLGYGTNSTASTFSVGLDNSHNYQVLDANGQIPAARLGTGFDASKTQVLKNVNGVLTWVDEA